MDQRVNRLFIFITILLLSLLLSSAYATSPTPKANPSAKATPAVSRGASVNPSVSPTTKGPTKKPVKKKNKVKKTATPIPSPSPIWPPIGFTTNKGIYAKIPTSKELLGLVSAKAGLAEVVKKCELNACGAVIVAADYRCEWWEIKSTVYGVDPDDASKKIALGKLRTLYGPLTAKTYANIILVSDEPLYGPAVLDPDSGQTVTGQARNGISLSGISAICHKSGTDEKFPANIYTPIR
jgi:hypothetical protein